MPSPLPPPSPAPTSISTGSTNEIVSPAKSVLNTVSLDTLRNRQKVSERKNSWRLALLRCTMSVRAVAIKRGEPGEIACGIERAPMNGMKTGRNERALERETLAFPLNDPRGTFSSHSWLILSRRVPYKQTSYNPTANPAINSNRLLENRTSPIVRERVIGVPTSGRSNAAILQYLNALLAWVKE